jgi:hypothetical protein
LVLRFGVEFTHPASGEGPQLVFHAAAGVERDAVADLLRERVWASNDLLVGWRSI